MGISMKLPPREWCKPVYENQKPAAYQFSGWTWDEQGVAGCSTAHRTSCRGEQAPCKGTRQANWWSEYSELLGVVNMGFTGRLIASGYTGIDADLSTT